MPRCSPAAYGCAGSKTNDWRTTPSVGHVHALAAGAQISTATATSRSTRRIGDTALVVWFEECFDGRRRRVALSNEITKLSQSRAVKVVLGHVGEPRDDLGRGPPGWSGRDQIGHGGTGLVGASRTGNG